MHAGLDHRTVDLRDHIKGLLVLPGHDPGRYWRHVVATLRPERGEGIAEAAAAFNARRRLARGRGAGN